MYKFDEFKRDIAIGREIEFKFKSNKYSISKIKNGWVFTKFNDIENNIVFKDLDGIDLISIDGQSIRDIFDKNTIEELTVF